MSCAGTVTVYSRLRPSRFVSLTCIEHPVPELFRISVQAMADGAGGGTRTRSEEHTSELQSLMRISYAVFCLKTKKAQTTSHTTNEDKCLTITKTLTQH